MAYADKRDGKATGSFVGEWTKGRKKRRFKTMRDAKDYETFCKLMGREPPTIDDGTPSTGAPKFAEVAKQCKDDGGPKGKWKRERDHSVIQRVDFAVGVLGAYEITYVADHSQEMVDKLLAALDRPRSSSKREPIGPATKNRYLNSFGAVLTYAFKKRLVTHRPKLDLLDERSERKERDVLPWGADEVVLRLMREAGNEVEALCVEVLLATGMREGELFKLSPDQITVGTIEHEDGTKEDIGAFQLRKDQTKNNTTREVLFPAELAKQIKAIIAAEKLPSPYKLLRNFKSAVGRAGYTGNIVIHSLRHTRNTRLGKAGVEQKIRMQSLGHTSAEVNNIYTHVDYEDQLEAAKKLEEYAGKRAKKAIVVQFPDRKSA